MDVDVWENQDTAETPTRSRAETVRLILGLVAGIALVAWLATSPNTVVEPDDGELALATDQPPPPTLDRITFLGNSLAIDHVPPRQDVPHFPVQWGGGSIAVPDQGGGAQSSEVFYLCDGAVVRVAADQTDLPPAVVIAGAGIHTRLVGCAPQLPDVPLEQREVASWSLPILTLLNTSSLTAEFSSGRGVALDVVLVVPDDDPLTLTLRPAFGGDGLPAVGSEYAAFAGGQILTFEDTRFLQCDRGAMMEVSGQSEALARYLDRMSCVPTAPTRPRDPMDDLMASANRLADRTRGTSTRVFDISPHRPAVRFTVAGPAGEVRMLALADVTGDRAGDRAVAVGEGEVIRRRDGGTVAACDGLILAIDPEYEPIAIPTLQAVADTGACTLARPSPMPT